MKLATATAATVLDSSSDIQMEHPPARQPNEVSMGGEAMTMPILQQAQGDGGMIHDMAVDGTETATGSSPDRMHSDPAAENGVHVPHSSPRPIDPAFAGCGRTDANASYHYGLINERMHRGMAINFTESSEFNFLAGMIPHHTAAVSMCNVYLHEVQINDDVAENEGIASLCYNITYGPIDGLGYGAQWQYDFSQPGETEQMMDVLKDIGMVEEYESGCSNMAWNENHHRRQTTTSTMDTSMTHGGGHHGSMFMGCGRLDLPEAKDYIAANMNMHGYMALNFTNNAAVDFLLGMIPHHEGAIEMCDVYYEYWGCPTRRPCWSAHPLDGIPSDQLTFEQTRNVLAAMKHICTDHIMTTQPKEVVWMKEELRRLSPDSLVAYETMQQMGHYPCSSTETPESDMMDQHSMHYDMTGQIESMTMDNNEDTDTIMMMDGHGERRTRRLRGIES